MVQMDIMRTVKYAETLKKEKSTKKISNSIGRKILKSEEEKKDLFM
jgi:hypothetical protein